MKKYIGIYILLFIIILLGFAYFLKSNIKEKDSSISFYPTCDIEDKDTPYITSGIKEWSEGPRNITVKCIDKDNNCMNKEYTKTFVNDSLVDYITIEDTDGNKKKCYVTTYIDKEQPEIIAKVFKVGEENEKTGAPLATISSREKDKLVTEDIKKNVNGYLNNNNFPNGVYLEVTIKDNQSLNNYSYEELENNNFIMKDKKKYEYSQSSKEELIKEDKMLYPINAEGERKSKITITDGANHTTVFNIEINIDRTAPNTPIVKMYKWTDNNVKPKKKDIPTLEEYTSNEWTSQNIYTVPSNSIEENEKIIYKFSSSGSTTKLIDYEAKSKNIRAQGISKISYSACDVADNCSSNSPLQIIKIDRTGPYFDISIKSNKKEYNTKDINYKFNASDALSGISKYCIGIDNECIPNIDFLENEKVDIKDYNISDNYDGETKKIYICVSDKVGNIICHNEEYNIYKECSKTKKEKECLDYSECNCTNNKKYADELVLIKDKYLDSICESIENKGTCTKKCKCK